MPKGDDKSYHPIVGDRGVKALKAVIQAHDERVACGFHDFHNSLIDLFIIFFRDNYNILLIL